MLFSFFVFAKCHSTEKLDTSWVCVIEMKKNHIVHTRVVSIHWRTEDPKIHLRPLLPGLMRLGVDPYNASFIDANDLEVDMPAEEERILEWRKCWTYLNVL